MRKWFMLSGFPVAVAIGGLAAGSTYLRLLWRPGPFVTHAEEV